MKKICNTVTDKSDKVKVNNYEKIQYFIWIFNISWALFNCLRALLFKR